MWIHSVPDELIIYNNIMSKHHRIFTESFPIFFSSAEKTEKLHGNTGILQEHLLEIKYYHYCVCCISLETKT